MKNIPNILTLLRIILIPIFLIGIYIDNANTRIALFILYIIIAITDFFDGYIARKYNAQSKFGKIFDPIADKIFVIIILLIISIRDPNIVKFIIIPTIIIIAREFIISGIRIYYSNSSEVNVNNFGKWKTTLQLIALGALILGNKAYSNFNFEPIGIITLYMATVLTIYSLYQYTKNISFK